MLLKILLIKKITHTIGWKKGINYYTDKTDYKKI